MHNPLNVDGYQAGDQYELTVQYDWYDSPAKDYTIKVYSKHSHQILNYDDANAPVGGQLFTDGVNTPSEFTGNPYSPGDMIYGTQRPQCEFDMSCTYCGANCDYTAPPDDFVAGSWTPTNVDTGYDQACLSGDGTGGDDGTNDPDDGTDDNNGGEDDWEWSDEDHGFDEWDGNFEDDDGSNDYTGGCVPDAFEGNSWGHVINVQGHSDPGYNGDYCQRADWAAGFHFEKDAQHHFYLYSYNDGTGCVQFDDRSQDGTRDYYNGGYLCDAEEYLEYTYLTHDPDQQWGFYLGSYMGITLRLHEIESNGVVNPSEPPSDGNEGDDDNDGTGDGGDSGSEGNGYVSSIEECGGEAIGGNAIDGYFADVLANMWGAECPNSYAFKWAEGGSCPAGFRYLLIDEIENEQHTRDAVQHYMGPWSIASAVNGWTEDEDSYPGQIVRDCGERSASRICVSDCKPFTDYVAAEDLDSESEYVNDDCDEGMFIHGHPDDAYNGYYCRTPDGTYGFHYQLGVDHHFYFISYGDRGCI